MTDRVPMKPSTRTALNVAVAIVVATAVFALPRIPQDLAYHAFADGRTVLGVKNFWNVVSNAPFVAVGAMGIAFVWRRRDLRTFAPHAVLFLGVLLTGVASAYYHLGPSNRTLVWDRLPMTLIFMSLYAALIAERASVKWGVRLLPVLVGLGVASVLWWRATEIAGRGDLRPYAIAQFYPFIGIVLLLITFPARYTRGSDILWIGMTYAVAKLAEVSDHGVFELTGGVVSGHTVKHLIAAGATYLILRNVEKRRPKGAGMAG
jgi:hypothetical protein